MEAAKAGEMTLDQCLATGMWTSHRRFASKCAVAVAEAQHRQALAAYWPRIGAKGAYQLMDQSPDFVFPAGQMRIPPQSINLIS